MLRRLLLFALLAVTAVAGAEKYDWTVYASYHNPAKSVEVGGRLYVLANGDLYSYDPSDTSIETYDKAGALNDFGIYDIVACSETGEVAIVYNNGNIDLLAADGTVFNLSDFKNKVLADKTMNDVAVYGKKLYLSTNSGLVVMDMGKRTFDNIYYWGSAVRSALPHENSIIAATDNGVYRGSLSVNLLDPESWEMVNTNKSFRKFFKVGSAVYCYTGRVEKITDMQTVTSSMVVNETVQNCFVCENQLFMTTSAGVLKSVDESGNQNAFSTPFVINHATYKSGTYWTACGTDGMIGMTLNGDAFTQTVGDITPNSPVRNYSYKMQMMPGGRLLVAGGNFNYPEVDYEGTAMKYEGKRWTAFDEGSVLEHVDMSTYKNVTDIVQDPNDSEHHWLGTKRSGIYEFRDYKYVNHYTYDNSPLESILPGNPYAGWYVRVTGLGYDPEGNLWMCNNQCDTIVRILTHDGKWVGYYYEDIVGYPTFDHTVFDSRGWAWINSRRETSVSHAGVLVVNTNGTIDTQRDDSHRFVHTITNQDGTSYPIMEFFTMQEDMEGAMWLGTSSGLFVAEAPENIFSPDYHFTQIKIARNDGTGLADYLLNEVWVTCIAIDGANRKWIGTGGSGVYLVSADGQEELHHFTKSDSPLISDNINDIKIDGTTGEVFIATDEGLCSYFGDAVDAEESLDKGNIKVYPNPIRPEMRRLVRVTGLAFNTNVKIANAAGRLVYEGMSNGGEFTWNCTTSGGKPVASGVYYILATDEEGKKGASAKVLILR